MPRRAEEVADDGDVRVEHFRGCCTSAVDGQRSRSPPSRFRAGRYRRGRLAGWRLALRRACRDRLLRRRLACVQLRFERAETIAVLLLQRVEFLTLLIDLLSQRLRVLRLRPQGRRRDQQRTGDGTDVRESQTPHDHSSAAGPLAPRLRRARAGPRTARTHANTSRNGEDGRHERS